MEQILNLAWLAVVLGTSAFVLHRRRDLKTAAVLIAFAALLFPIISASDDMTADRTLIDAFAAVLVAFTLLLALVSAYRLAVEQRLMHSLAVITYSDPRSPPRV